MIAAATGLTAVEKCMPISCNKPNQPGFAPERGEAASFVEALAG